MVAGVAGGLAQYFNVDPVLFRLGFVLLALTPGLGVVVAAYIVLAVVVPLRPADEVEPEITSSLSMGHGREIAGFVLLGLGVMLLAANLGVFWFLRWDLFWPLVLVGVGAFLLVNRVRD